MTDYFNKYPVLLDGKKDSKKFYVFEKMQMKLGATQIDPNLALCLNRNTSVGVISKFCKRF